MEDRRFYVYEWIRLDTNEPFYVGKGCGRRALSLRGRNRHFHFVYNKVDCAVSILCDNLTEQEAYESEVWFIYEYDCVFGFKLVNADFGGCGALSGMFNPMYGRRAEKSPLYGRKASIERGINISNALKGRKKTDKHKESLKKACSNRQYQGKDNPNYGNGHKVAGMKNGSAAEVEVIDGKGMIVFKGCKIEASEKFGLSKYLLNKLKNKKIVVNEDFNREYSKYLHLEGFEFKCK